MDSMKNAMIPTMVMIMRIEMRKLWVRSLAVSSI